MNMDLRIPPPLLNKNHNPQWCHILQIYKSFSKELFHVHNMTDSPALAQVPLNLGSNFHNYGKGVHAHHNYLLSLSAEYAQLKSSFKIAYIFAFSFDIWSIVMVHVKGHLSNIGVLS